MKIAIHHRKEGFSRYWIKYCKDNQLPFKIVNCYSNSIIQDVEDCDIVMWHFHQTNCKDVLFAKQLMYSFQTSGKRVFPDFHTSWHFDDKVGQKYLLESMGAPLVTSYVYYDKEKAINWTDQADLTDPTDRSKGIE